MATESYKERQEDELQVLQAIFMTDLKDMRENDAWKVDRPPELCITLKPQQSIGNIGGESYVQLDLIFKCPENYPDSIPSIKIENPKGISNQQILALKKDLEKKAKELLGEEMLLELSQIVQQFLYTNNKPPPKSFYEQMISNKQKEEERQAMERQRKIEIRRKKEEKEMEIIEGQIQKRREELKEETRKRREETRQASKERQTEEKEEHKPEMLSAQRKSPSPSPEIFRQYSEPVKSNKKRLNTSHSVEDEGNQCKHHTGGVVELSFCGKPQRNIQRGRCLGHGLHGSTVYVGMDTRTGELVAISEWVLKWRHAAKKSTKTDKSELDKESEMFMKQILSIEQEMLSLLKLNHKNLLHYLAMKHSEEPGKICIYVLMEYSGGQNLDIYLTRKTLSVDTLRVYTTEILEALQHLHSKAVVHKNMRASSVFVDMNGSIRLADYSLNKRLCDLYNMVEASKPGVKFTNKQLPASCRGGKKGDIFDLGVLILSLAKGSQIEDMVPTVPHNLPTTLKDFLSKCLLADEKLRWSSNQLLDHAFLKEPIDNLPQLKEPPENIDIKENIPKKNTSFEEEEDLLPLITAWEASGQSRLTSEFDVIKSLGKGGFGDVLKVKNKLDGRFYAIKRIPLNPKSQQFNRKITREVKLLSRLSHENVVRYYNSWIETSDEPASSESSSSISGTPKNSTSERKVSLPSHYQKNSLDLMDDVEKNVPKFTDDASIDFSISYEASRSRSTGMQDASSESSDDDYEDDNADVFGIFMDENLEDSSDNIIFEYIGEDEQQVSETDQQKDKAEDASDTDFVVPKQYLYIQMEYCEKSTLRNCIDDGLYKDVDRVWRLFREIVEGLVHIHGQGMIHRDLKPVNIFLDSNDHVKIGDFGLATSDIIPKSNILDNAMLMTSAGDILDSLSRSGSLGDGNLTGMVGTALYVSPEMMVKSNKITYSQKVDLYSLGIIFFEMCYRPLQTYMERVQIIGNLRLSEIKFPEDFNVVEMEYQYKILQWILNHDPNERPSSKELLQSKYIPLPQLEEEELNEVLRSTISDPQCKAYHRLMAKLFSQTVSIADDHVYDSDIHKSSFSLKSSLTHRMVTDTLEKVFQLHGAIKLSTPLLIPRPKIYESVDQYACLMDHSGRLVGLPFDLRMPFARYVVRTNIHHVKRYCIEKVYRKRKGSGFHPRERIECAFDIVTSKPDNLIPDAEVMVVAQDIVNEFPPLQQRKYYFRVNHTLVLKAALLHAGIPEEKHQSVLSLLAEAKRDSKSTTKLLTSLSVSEQSSSLLLSILEIEGSINKVNTALKSITKTKGQAGSLAKQALHEMEAVITNAQHLGLKMPVIVSVGWILNSPMYHGVVFQLAIDVIRNKKPVSEMLAAGGRYDHLISQFRSMRDVSSAKGVGMCIAFEKIVSAFLEQKDFQPQSAYDILVCTIGRKTMLKERMATARDLWNAGLRAEILHENLESIEVIQDFCRAHGVSYLVILKDSDGSMNLKVRSIEKERVMEKVLLPSKLVEFLTQRLLHSDEVEQKQSGQNTVGKGNNNIENSNQQQSSGCNMVLNSTFLLQDGKFSYSARKRYESIIVSKITTSYPWLLTMKSLEVVALDLTVGPLRTIAGFLDIDSTESAFTASIGAIVEKQPRHKKYLSKIMDHIHDLVFEQKCSCILLYGLKDESVKLLTSS